MNKILVIENDKRTASLAVEELKSGLKDVSLYVCLTGLEGLKSLKRRSFDLVISESILSDMTGFELLKGMEDLGGHWPAIILSSPGRGDEAVRYMRSGVYDYIVKDNSFPQTLPRAAQRALDLSYLFNEKRNMIETGIKREWRRELARLAQVFNHEVNNPLMTIIGNTQILLTKSEIKPEELRDKLEAIEDSARRIARVMAFFADRNLEPYSSFSEQTSKNITVPEK